LARPSLRVAVPSDFSGVEGDGFAGGSLTSFVDLVLVVGTVLVFTTVVVVEGAGASALAISATFAAAADLAAAALAAAVALAFAIALAATNGGFTGDGLRGGFFAAGIFTGDLELLRGDLTLGTGFAGDLDRRRGDFSRTGSLAGDFERLRGDLSRGVNFAGDLERFLGERERWRCDLSREGGAFRYGRDVVACVVSLPLVWSTRDRRNTGRRRSADLDRLRGDRPLERLAGLRERERLRFTSLRSRAESSIRDNRRVGALDLSSGGVAGLAGRDVAVGPDTGERSGVTMKTSTGVVSRLG